MPLFGFLRPPAPPRPSPPPRLLDIAGIPVTLQRKRMRTLRLRLDRQGRWQASAPLRAPLSEVEAFLLSKKAWMEKALAQWEAAQSRRPGADLPPPTPAELRRRRAALLARAESLRPNWEAALGVRASVLRVRAMRSRWGSCNLRSQAVTLSLSLWARGDEALELILVHELAHLIEGGHGPRFKALMDRHLPDWRVRWKRMRQGLDAPAEMD